MIAKKGLQGKPSEYKDFYDNCKYLLNRQKKVEMNLYIEEEYEGILTNTILENEIKELHIQRLKAEVFENYLNINFNGNLIDL